MKKLPFVSFNLMLAIPFRMMTYIHIVTETINFPIPLVQVNEHIFSLEFFHGPTLHLKM